MPKFEKLSYYVNPQVSVVPGSKNAGAVTPVVVDASGGFDRVQHVIALGSFGTNAGFDAEITESATSGGTYTLIASSGMAAVTSSAANKLVVIDVPVNPNKPYQKIRSTASTAAVAICAISNCYNGTRPLGTALGDVQEEVYVA